MRRLLVVVAACLLLAGCKVDTTLTIDVHDNGGGSARIRVALDADAVQNAQAGGGRLEDRVRLGDLQAAGWTVSPWRRARDGSATVSLRKDFANAGELAGVVAELSGKDGPLRGVTLERSRGLLSTDYKVKGEADLSRRNAGEGVNSTSWRPGPVRGGCWYRCFLERAGGDRSRPWRILRCPRNHGQKRCSTPCASWRRGRRCGRASTAFSRLAWVR